MTTLRLLPTIPMATPLGDAEAHFLHVTGPGQHNQWTCAVCKTGEWWTFDNTAVRRNVSVTDGYNGVSAFTPDVLTTYHWGAAAQGIDHDRHESA